MEDKTRFKVSTLFGKASSDGEGERKREEKQRKVKPVCYDVLLYWFLLNNKPQRDVVGCLVFLLLGTQSLFVRFAIRKQVSEESMGKRKKREVIYVVDFFQFPFPLVKVHLTECQFLKLSGCIFQPFGGHTGSQVLRIFIKIGKWRGKQHRHTVDWERKRKNMWESEKNNLRFLSPYKGNVTCTFLTCNKL